MFMCFLDKPIEEAMLAQKKACSFGIDAWVLDFIYWAELLDWLCIYSPIPFCFKIPIGFGAGNQECARLANAINAMLLSNLYATHDKQPIIIIDAECPDSPSGRGSANEWHSTASALSCLALANSLLLIKGNVQEPPASSIMIESALDRCTVKSYNGIELLDYAGRLRKAWYQSLGRKKIWRLTPPAERPRSRAKAAVPLRNYTPENYYRESKILKAISRLSAPYATSDSLVYIDSWSGHYINTCPDYHLSQPKNKLKIMSSHKSCEGKWISSGSIDPSRTAIAIHAYHIDELVKIVNKRELLIAKNKVDLFVTVPIGLASTIHDYLSLSSWNHEVLELENRGRDVMPFICYQLPRIEWHGHKILVKIHTKKSSHLAHGQDWGNWLQNEILKKVSIGTIGQFFLNNPRAGLLVPKGTSAPITLHIEENIEWLEDLVRKIGLQYRQLHSVRFATGTMFIVKTACLADVRCLQISPLDFECEAGQLDGTLAHALERFLGIACYHSGYHLRQYKPSIPLKPFLGYIDTL